MRNDWLSRANPVCYSVNMESPSSKVMGPASTSLHKKLPYKRPRCNRHPALLRPTPPCTTPCIKIAISFFKGELQQDTHPTEPPRLTRICIHCVRSIAAGEESPVSNWMKYEPYFGTITIYKALDLKNEDMSCHLCLCPLFIAPTSEMLLTLNLDSDSD